MKLTIVVLTNILILTGAGIAGLFFSREIQKYMVLNSRRLRLYRAFLESDRFIIHLKVCGAAALIMVLLILYASLRSKL
jgi:hypothetical protein